MDEAHETNAGPDTETSIRQSSAVFLAEVERLSSMERQKRDMAPDDPARPGLAREIEDLTVNLMTLGRYQTRLVDLGAPTPVDTAPPRRPAAILADWRDSERRMFDARAALERAVDETDRLRDEHRRSIE